MSPSACGSRDRMNGNADSGQMTCVTPPASSPGRRRDRTIRGTADDGVLVFRRERRALRNVGLHQPQPDAGRRRARRSRQPLGAERGDRREREDRGDRRRRSDAALPNAPERRGRRKHGDGDEGEAVEADCRGDLSQRQIGAERHAEVVPWEAGEEEAARPFAHVPARRRAQRPATARKTREGRRARIRRPGKKPIAAGRTTTPNGSAQRNLSPSTRQAAPTHQRPDEEIAEPEPPARAESRFQPRQTAARRRRLAIRRSARPRPSWGRPSARTEPERRQSESADRPGQQRDRAPAPSRGQDNDGGQVGHRAGEHRESRGLAQRENPWRASGESAVFWQRSFLFKRLDGISPNSQARLRLISRT